MLLVNTPSPKFDLKGALLSASEESKKLLPSQNAFSKYKNPEKTERLLSLGKNSLSNARLCLS
jgi:hypothetical protein